MSLVRWKSLSDLEKLFEDEDWFLPVFPRLDAGKPAMDVYETDKEVIAEVNIPDFNPEKVDVSVEDNILKISGKMEENKEEKGKDYWRKEIRKGSFERMIKLPVSVKEGAIEATYEKGVLRIVMPKAEAKPASKIKIQVKEK